VLLNDGNLSIPRYVRPTANGADDSGDRDLTAAWVAFDSSGREFWQQANLLVDMLDSATAEEAPDV